MNFFFSDQQRNLLKKNNNKQKYQAIFKINKTILLVVIFLWMCAVYLCSVCDYLCVCDFVCLLICIYFICCACVGSWYVIVSWLHFRRLLWLFGGTNPYPDAPTITPDDSTGPSAGGDGNCTGPTKLNMCPTGHEQRNKTKEKEQITRSQIN